jgi:Family of unknown function (DUF6232)
MSEVTHLSEGDVQVTDARIVVGPTTYVLQTLNSVRAVELPKPDGPGVTLLWIALLASGIAGIAAITNPWWLVAIPIILLFALLLIWKTRPVQMYGVVLGSSTGETTAYTSPDLPAVQRIVEAVNQAIVARSTAIAAVAEQINGEKQGNTP